MKLEQDFTLHRPRSAVWDFFQDVPAVAACLPGAEYLGAGEDGAHKGRMSMKVGPFQASFEGAAEVSYDEASHTVEMSGKGVDKRGASRGKMTMCCVLLEEEAGTTRVMVDADVQLSGSIAQFGRTGIIQEIAATLIKDFVANVEASLPAPRDAGAPGAAPAEARAADPRPSAPISGGRLLWLSLRSWFRGLFAGAK